jgi:hypothetical protein
MVAVGVLRRGRVVTIALGTVSLCDVDVYHSPVRNNEWGGKFLGRLDIFMTTGRGEGSVERAFRWEKRGEG